MYSEEAATKTKSFFCSLLCRKMSHRQNVGAKRKQPSDEKRLDRSDRDDRRKQREGKRDLLLKDATEEMNQSLDARKRLRKAKRKAERDAEKAQKKQGKIKALTTAVVGHPLTAIELRNFQKAYASNPERLWSNTSEVFKCSYDDTKNDSVLWTTTRKLGDMIASRSTEGFIKARQAILSGEIAIAYVDCFLPVTRDLEDPYCLDCRHGSSTGYQRPYPPASCRKRSILRSWIGAADVDYNSLSPNGITLSPRGQQLLWFFNDVLLPTGLASRYNEVFNCRGQSVGTFTAELFRVHMGDHDSDYRDDPKIKISPMMILAARFSPQSMIAFRGSTVNLHGSSDSEKVVLELLTEHQNKQMEEKTKIQNFFDALKSVGCVFATDNGESHALGEIKSLSPWQLVVAYVYNDLV
jgi:hypothetical protein